MDVREHTAEGIYYYETTFASPRDAELPLVVAFHGRGGAPQRPEGLYYGVREPMRLIVPRGPRALGDGFAWFDANATEEAGVLAEQQREASDRIAALVASVADRHPTRGARVATGFSQGGAIALALAVRHSELLTHAFPLASFMPGELVPAAPPARIPIRLMHGRGDPVVPFVPTAHLADTLRARGYDVELHTFDTTEHVTTAEMAALLHRWLGAAITPR